MDNVNTWRTAKQTDAGNLDPRRLELLFVLHLEPITSGMPIREIIYFLICLILYFLICLDHPYVDFALLATKPS